MASQTYPAPPSGPHGTPYGAPAAPTAPYGAPGARYGAPAGPYGPPPGLGHPQPTTPPRKRTGKLVGAIIGGLLLVAGAAIGALLLFGTRTLDEQKLTDLITSTTKDAGADATGVSCPADVEVQQGDTFTCSATVDGQQVKYTVTQIDDKGQVQVQSQGRFVPLADAEKAVSSQVSSDAGVDVTTSCEAGGHTTLVVTDSTDLRCTVTSTEDSSQRAQVTATIDSEGSVTVTYDQ